MPIVRVMRHCGTLRRVRRRLSSERGLTLSELLTAMVILSFVLAGLTGVFVSASRGEIDLNKRFQAQEKARLALDKLRREVHCASSVSPSSQATATSRITVTLGSWCATGSGQVTWCAAASGNRYQLLRVTGAPATCTGGVAWADSLTTSSIFTTSLPSTSTLAKVGVCLAVNTTTKTSTDSCTTHTTKSTYVLSDDIVMRNSGRQ